MNKKQVVNAILNNSVYLPESRLRQSLAAALETLPRPELDSLKLIVELKVQDAKQPRVVVAPEPQSIPRACRYCGEEDCPSPQDCPTYRQHREEDRLQ